MSENSPSKIAAADQLFKLTTQREIMPYTSVHPDEDDRRSSSPSQAFNGSTRWVRIGHISGAKTIARAGDGATKVAAWPDRSTIII
jgi:hypothetical protein